VIRQRVLVVLKSLVAMALCVFLVRRVEWADAGATLSGARPSLLAIVFLSMVANVVLSAVKWRLLLRVHGVDWPLRILTRHYFVAMFVNNFLPTSIGGDGYRIVSTLENSRSRSAAVVAVLMERVTGIGALLLLGTLGALIVGDRGDPDVGRFMLAVGALTTAGILLAVGLLVRPDLMRRLAGAIHLPPRFAGVVDRLAEFRHHPIAGLQVIALSFGFHIFSLAWLAILLAALDGRCGLPELAVIQALTNLTALLPLSINGLGIQDGAFVFLAGRYGVAYESALFAAAAIRIFLVPISIAGGVLYLRRGRTDSLRGTEGRRNTQV
jgi:hypothetical protein